MGIGALLAWDDDAVKDMIIRVGRAPIWWAGLRGGERVRVGAPDPSLTGVSGLCSTTAAGLAHRVSQWQWAMVERRVARVSARMLARVPRCRREALMRSVTIDLDTTDVEMYGRHKCGVAYNYQGQCCGRPHVATWAELGGGADCGLAGVATSIPARGRRGCRVARWRACLPIPGC